MTKKGVLLEILAAFQVLSFVSGTGFVETNFIRFENPEGKRFDGSCCDKAGIWGWGRDKCVEPCDHSFIICLGNITQSSNMNSCEFGRKETDVVGGNDIRFNGRLGISENPVKFKFDKWPGVMKLKIDVLDIDGETSFDFVDHFEYQYTTSDLRREIDAPTTNLVLSGSRTRFDLDLKVFCEVNYFGQDCSIFCKPRDDVIGHYKCDPVNGEKICRTGWQGENCTMNVDDCVGDRCHSESICVDGVNSYTCLCKPGRTGMFCEGEINECASQPCLNNGICVDASNGFVCNCQPGFIGSQCQINVDECLSSPCLNGGTCNDDAASYTCECPPGFSGDRCHVQVNECDSSPCLHSSACIDLVGDFSCSCLPGYAGKFCDVNINECYSAPCLNDGVCVDNINSYMCYCKPGITGTNCETEINFCWPDPCLNGGDCIDTGVSFLCDCSDGFTGPYCERDVNECDYILCHNGGNCVNLHGSFQCHCMEGYTGIICAEDVDECASSPCATTGICVDLLGDYKCDCYDGFKGDKCDIEIDECVSTPCLNNGTCQDMLAGFSCVCTESYSGAFCEQFIGVLSTSSGEEFYEVSLTLKQKEDKMFVTEFTESLSFYPFFDTANFFKHYITPTPTLPANWETDQPIFTDNSLYQLLQTSIEPSYATGTFDANISIPESVFEDTGILTTGTMTDLPLMEMVSNTQNVESQDIILPTKGIIHVPDSSQLDSQYVVTTMHTVNYLFSNSSRLPDENTDTLGKDFFHKYFAERTTDLQYSEIDVNRTEIPKTITSVPNFESKRVSFYSEIESSLPTTEDTLGTSSMIKKESGEAINDHVTILVSPMISLQSYYMEAIPIFTSSSTYTSAPIYLDIDGEDSLSFDHQSGYKEYLPAFITPFFSIHDGGITKSTKMETDIGTEDSLPWTEEISAYPQENISSDEKSKSDPVLDFEEEMLIQFTESPKSKYKEIYYDGSGSGASKFSEIFDLPMGSGFAGQYSSKGDGGSGSGDDVVITFDEMSSTDGLGSGSGDWHPGETTHHIDTEMGVITEIMFTETEEEEKLQDSASGVDYKKELLMKVSEFPRLKFSEKELFLSSETDTHSSSSDIEDTTANHTNFLRVKETTHELSDKVKTGSFLSTAVPAKGVASEPPNKVLPNTTNQNVSNSHQTWVQTSVIVFERLEPSSDEILSTKTQPSRTKDANGHTIIPNISVKNSLLSTYKKSDFSFQTEETVPFSPKIHQEASTNAIRDKTTIENVFAYNTEVSADGTVATTDPVKESIVTVSPKTYDERPSESTLNNTLQGSDLENEKLTSSNISAHVSENVSLLIDSTASILDATGETTGYTSKTQNSSKLPKTDEGTAFTSIGDDIESALTWIYNTINPISKVTHATDKSTSLEEESNLQGDIKIPEANVMERERGTKTYVRGTGRKEIGFTLKTQPSNNTETYTESSTHMKTAAVDLKSRPLPVGLSKTMKIPKYTLLPKPYLTNVTYKFGVTTEDLIQKTPTYVNVLDSDDTAYGWNQHKNSNYASVPSNGKSITAESTRQLLQTDTGTSTANDIMSSMSTMPLLANDTMSSTMPLLRSSEPYNAKWGSLSTFSSVKYTTEPTHQVADDKSTTDDYNKSFMDSENVRTSSFLETTVASLHSNEPFALKTIATSQAFTISPDVKIKTISNLSGTFDSLEELNRLDNSSYGATVDTEKLKVNLSLTPTKKHDLKDTARSVVCAIFQINCEEKTKTLCINCTLMSRMPPPPFPPPPPDEIMTHDQRNTGEGRSELTAPSTQHHLPSASKMFATETETMGTDSVINKGPEIVSPLAQAFKISTEHLESTVTIKSFANAKSAKLLRPTGTNLKQSTEEVMPEIKDILPTMPTIKEVPTTDKKSSFSPRWSKVFTRLGKIKSEPVTLFVKQSTPFQSSDLVLLDPLTEYVHYTKKPTLQEFFSSVKSPKLLTGFSGSTKNTTLEALASATTLKMTTHESERSIPILKEKSASVGTSPLVKEKTEITPTTFDHTEIDSIASIKYTFANTSSYKQTSEFSPKRKINTTSKISILSKRLFTQELEMTLNPKTNDITSLKKQPLDFVTQQSVLMQKSEVPAQSIESITDLHEEKKNRTPYSEPLTDKQEKYTKYVTMEFTSPLPSLELKTQQLKLKTKQSNIDTNFGLKSSTILIDDITSSSEPLHVVTADSRLTPKAKSRDENEMPDFIPTEELTFPSRHLELFTLTPQTSKYSPSLSPTRELRTRDSETIVRPNEKTKMVTTGQKVISLTNTSKNTLSGTTDKFITFFKPVSEQELEASAERTSTDKTPSAKGKSEFLTHDSGVTKKVTFEKKPTNPWQSLAFTNQSNLNKEHKSEMEPTDKSLNSTFDTKELGMLETSTMQSLHLLPQEFHTRTKLQVEDPISLVDPNEMSTVGMETRSAHTKVKEVISPRQPLTRFTTEIKSLTETEETTKDSVQIIPTISEQLSSLPKEDILFESKYSELQLKPIEPIRYKFDDFDNSIFGMLSDSYARIMEKVHTTLFPKTVLPKPATHAPEKEGASKSTSRQPSMSSPEPGKTYLPLEKSADLSIQASKQHTGPTITTETLPDTTLTGTVDVESESDNVLLSPLPPEMARKSKISSILIGTTTSAENDKPSQDIKEKGEKKTAFTTTEGDDTTFHVLTPSAGKTATDDTPIDVTTPIAGKTATDDTPIDLTTSIAGNTAKEDNTIALTTPIAGKTATHDTPIDLAKSKEEERLEYHHETISLPTKATAKEYSAGHISENQERIELTSTFDSETSTGAMELQKKKNVFGTIAATESWPIRSKTSISTPFLSRETPASLQEDTGTIYKSERSVAKQSRPWTKASRTLLNVPTTATVYTLTSSLKSFDTSQSKLTPTPLELTTPQISFTQLQEPKTQRRHTQSVHLQQSSTLPPKRHQHKRMNIDTVSKNSTYFKQIYEYNKNSSVYKHTSSMSLSMIRVTVYKLIGNAKRTVSHAVDMVKNTAVVAYKKAKAIIKYALKRVKTLIKLCRKKLKEINQTSQIYLRKKLKSIKTYLKDNFARGKLIFASTVARVKQETVDYFTDLSQYYINVYDRFSGEVRDMYNSL